MCTEMILYWNLYWFYIDDTLYRIKRKNSTVSCHLSFYHFSLPSDSIIGFISQSQSLSSLLDEFINKSASSSLETFLVPLRWATLRDALTYTPVSTCVPIRVHRHAFATYEHTRLHTYNQARIKSVPKKERKLLFVDMKSDVG